MKGSAVSATTEELLFPSMTGVTSGARGPHEKVGHLPTRNNWRKALCDQTINGVRYARPVSYFRGGLCKRCAKKAGRR